MKFNCGETREEKRIRELNRHNELKDWHPFFPWWPRQVGSKDCRCFEWIERKGTWDYYDGGFGWEYRKKQNEHDNTES